MQNKLRDDFPLNEERRSPKPLLLLDPNKNGWFIPSGQKLHISKKTQQSPYAKTDKPGQGLFLKAWLDHGYGPESESYEYAQLIDSSTSQLNEFAHRQQKGEGYKVLQKDEFAHIVKYDGTYAFAIANTKSEFNYNILRSVNFPCLLMMIVQGYTVKMSICDPDLRLYEGRDHEQYDQAGRQREVSIYSRPWAQNESAPSRLMVRLKGKWSVKKNPAVKAKINASQTVLIITCQHGLAVDLELKKL
ncbi:MAG: hypothetical protein HRT88_22345 [Lentisphaeraceae bacterium]|nr:hypothetical protein [Lentisphaeraceae bacterium]